MTTEKKRKYQREYMSKRLKEDPEFKKRQRGARNQWKKKRKAKVFELLSVFRNNGCYFCGEKEHCCLDAHHIRDKKFNISLAIRQTYPLDKIIAELKNCVCVCSNCHRKIHFKVLISPIDALLDENRPSI